MLMVLLPNRTALAEDIQALRNLGKTATHWLRAIGIHDRSQLAELGSAVVYNRVRQRGLPANVVLLYSLEGALRDVRWRDLDEATKADLRDQAASDENMPGQHPVSDGSIN